MAIHGQGHEAISFTGGQIGLVTDNAFSKARIQSINKQRIFDQLTAGKRYVRLQIKEVNSANALVAVAAFTDEADAKPGNANNAAGAVTTQNVVS